MINKQLQKGCADVVVCCLRFVCRMKKEERVKKEERRKKRKAEKQVNKSSILYTTMQIPSTIHFKYQQQINIIIMMYNLHHVHVCNQNLLALHI